MRVFKLPGKRLAQVIFSALAFASLTAAAQTITPAPTLKTPPAVLPVPAVAPKTLSGLDQLAQANRDLIDLLKKQQAVLEDIQVDRRLLNRQNQLLEEHLGEILQKNTELQTKIAGLEATLAARPTQSAGGNGTTPGSDVPVAKTVPPPPATFLPPPESEGAPGTLSWHRLFALSGSDGRTSDQFKIEGKQWRVLWHNQDRPGEVYQNTSALFIHAFPKNDPIPQNVCAKLGSGGESSELLGPGTFYLKIEESGGKWECAVEDFR